ncbi:gpW family head-tail joining protein [Ancylobacter amanitiformis]|uniref:Uncharacterized protein n=1 Tax=Ancylobacter amanitiformis TaxID=217069 RepID=A0ABU0LQE9_9HYPH|nr:gpW family head-tail joining protein [Ancylobacter amanitiformis]MDQ0510888.1 hypothetical protein [Ancylobacter amanitiformis]
MAIDYELIFGVEQYDPCAALVALRPAYMRLMAGGQVEKVSFRDRETWFAKSDVAEFKLLIDRLESECAEKRGCGPTRFAIRAGAPARPGGFDPFKV